MALHRMLNAEQDNTSTRSTKQNPPTRCAGGRVLTAGQEAGDASRNAPVQSACLRRKAGISISSMPLELSASTLAAAWVRPERQTLGVLSAS